MLERKLAAAGLCVGLLSTLGCGQSSSESRPSAAAPAADSNVRVASAEELVTADDAEPASAESAAAEPVAENSSDASDDAVASAPVESVAAAPAAEAAPQAPAKLAPAAAIPLDEAPESELSLPKVSLSDAHAALCKVKVGDAFPSLPASDVAGQASPATLGEKLTVVVFWNGSKPTALEQLGDLGPEIAARFAPRGVKVVAINSGDDAQLAAELAKKAAADYTLLGDEGGKLLEQVAPGRVPSTWLLDASGRVVWFDIEYSRTTRRDLVQAIRFLLAQK